MLAFLEERFPHIQAVTWVSRMDRGLIVENNGQQIYPSSPYREGIRIYYYRELEYEPRIPFIETILFEDENLLVVDKPHFVPVVPSGRFLQESLLVRLRRSGKFPALTPLHRLDRETAGLVMFSLDPKTRGQYTRLFRERKIEKIYEALAPSSAQMSFPVTRRSRIVRAELFFRMQETKGEPNAETRIELATGSFDSKFARYRLFPVTGKKHQLRLHLSALGIPVLNDRLYPEYVRELNGVDDYSRPLKLLAKSIAFRDPISGNERYFGSPRELNVR